MKTLLTLILSVTGIYFSIAQPAIQWQKSFGGSDYEEANSIQQTTDGGYILAGWTYSHDSDVTVNHGKYDFWILKLNSAGTLQWQKSLGGSQNDEALSIQQTSDGGYIAGGWSSSADGDASGNHGGSDYWIVKLDGTGNIQWQKCLGGSGDEGVNSIQQTADGGYILAGESTSNDGDVGGNHGGWDYWIVKVNSSGAIQWQKNFGGDFTEYARSVRQTFDGGYIVAGLSESDSGDVTGNHGAYDYWVVKLDSTGALQWQKSLGGTDFDEAYSVQQTFDGGYIIAGNAASSDGDVTGNKGYIDYWIVKLSSSGAIQWKKAFGGFYEDDAYSIQQTTDHGFLIAGSSYSDDADVRGYHGGSDYWIVKIDSVGAIQWQKCLGGSSYEYAYCIQQTSDGGCVVAGSSESIDGDVSGNHGDYDYWIVKLDDFTGIEEQSSFTGFAIYPNPTAGIIHISMAKSMTEAEVNIFNVLGEKIYTERFSGNREIINLKLEEGIYFVQLTDGKESWTNKIVSE